MEEIDIAFDKNLDYIIELKGELVNSKQLMNSDNSLKQYRGANLILCSYLSKYNNLSDNAKKHINENINELEKMAVKILVDQGHSNIINEDLLKKYRYSSSTIKKFRQNPNTK